MIIISDSSVLMNLAKINQLSLLPNIFSEIIIPKAVFEEVVILGKDKAGSKEIADNWFIRSAFGSKEGKPDWKC